MEEEFKKNKFSFFDKSIFYIVFGIWLFIDQESKVISYSPLMILFLYFITNIIFKRKRARYYNNQFKYFPFFLLIAWLYGVIIGLLFNNDNVFVNNVGILFFGTYYFISHNKLTNNQLYRILVNLTGIGCFFYMLNIKQFIQESISNYQFGDRLGYNTIGIFVITLLPLLLNNLFFRNKENLIITKKIINVLFFILVFTIGVIFTASKGIYLSIIVILFLLTIFRFGTLNWPIIVFSIYIILVYLNLDFSVLTIFGESDVSNVSRFKMINRILPELTFFGEGWGARYIDSYIAGRDSAGYSTELSYLNLIHKIGIVSLVFFMFYMWTFFHIVKLLAKKNIKLLSSGLMAFGLVTYLFTSIGNPSLFSPTFVFMNVLALHIINKQLMNNKYFKKYEK
mgnify:FL=1